MPVEGDDGAEGIFASFTAMRDSSMHRAIIAVSVTFCEESISFFRNLSGAIKSRLAQPGNDTLKAIRRTPSLE